MNYLNKDEAERVWNAFEKAASGWQFSKGKELLYFTPPTEPEDYHDPVYDDAFDFLLKESLIAQVQKQQPSSQVSLAEAFGNVFVITDKGRTLYAELSKLDEAWRKTRFYALVEIEVL